MEGQHVKRFRGIVFWELKIIEGHVDGSVS